MRGGLTKRSSAAWIEDQDFFRFSGLFREVFLYAKPEAHVEDLWAKAGLKEDNGDGHTGCGAAPFFRKSTGGSADFLEPAGDRPGAVEARGLHRRTVIMQPDLPEKKSAAGRCTMRRRDIGLLCGK